MFGLTPFQTQAAGVGGALLVLIIGVGILLLRRSDTDTPDGTAVEAAKSGGARLGNIAAQALIVPSAVVYSASTTFGRIVIERIPFLRSSFWQGLTEFAVYRHQKATGADAVALYHGPTGITPLAVKWQDGDETEDERGWRVLQDDSVIHPGTEGRDTERFGKANVLIVDGSTAQSARPFELSVAEALDLENVEGLIEGAEVNFQQIDVWPQDPEEFSAGGQAVADGGVAEPELVDRQTDMTLHASEAGLADSIVTLRDQTRISVRKYRDFLKEQVGSERLKLAEDRGFAAGVGQDGTGEVSAMIKGFLIAAGAFVAYKLGPMALQMLFGDGGSSASGGGGGGIPFLFAHVPDALVGLGM